jgi:hypothetical protein
MAIEMIAQEFEAAVPIRRIKFNPANPNQGDVGLLCEVAEANGFAGAVLAQKSTGILIDGETRLRMAQETGLGTLPVLWCDVDDETRDRLLAEYNETTRRGSNDERKLLDLLTRFAGSPGGLIGTAFDGDDVDALMARLNEPLNITGTNNGGEYNETDQEQQDRQDAVGGYTDRKMGGNLVEMILVFTTGQREEVGRLMDSCRGMIGGEIRGAELILSSLRVHEAVLEGRTADAIELAKPEPLGGDDAAAGGPQDAE